MRLFLGNKKVWCCYLCMSLSRCKIYPFLTIWLYKTDCYRNFCSGQLIGIFKIRDTKLAHYFFALTDTSKVIKMVSLVLVSTRTDGRMTFVVQHIWSIPVRRPFPARKWPKFTFCEQEMSIVH